MRRTRLEVVRRGVMTCDMYRELTALCGEAYEEDFSELMADYGESAVHVIGFDGGTVASHGLWVPRRVRAGERDLRAASVEALATRPSHQGRGFGGAVLSRIVQEMGLEGFELGVLWAFDVGWYERRGWELWRGPVAQEGDDGLEPLTGDDVMIHRLPRTPMLDVDAALVAA